MLRRRLTLVLAASAAVTAAAGVAAGVRPWSVATSEAVRFAGARLGGYGLALAAEGPASLTLLPMPRLSIARARLTAEGASGPPLAEGGLLTVEFSPVAMLLGRAAVGALDLDGPTLYLGSLAEDRRWSAVLARMVEGVRRDEGSHPRRIGLSGARIAAAAPSDDASDIDLVLSWPTWSAVLNGQASFTWRGERASLTVADLRPADLAAGARSPFSLRAGWPWGSLTGQGQAGLSDALKVTGEARLETRALPETLAWIGASAPLLPLADAFALDGRLEMTGREMLWPQVRVGLGGNVLEGAGSMSLSGERPSVRATLAADTLNLAPVAGALVRLFDRARPASDPPPRGETASLAPRTRSIAAAPGREPVRLQDATREDVTREDLAREPARAGGGPAPSIAIGALTGGDLDLRLSASAGRVGPVALADLAASVLVRRDGIEIGLNRATLQGATLKGRLALAAADPDGGRTEFRAQGAFDRLDLGALMLDVGEARWLSGAVQGHFALEGAGRDAAALLARVSGRADLSVDGGAIGGLDLAEVAHRNGAVAQGPLARRNARTPFERASLSLRFADGVGEIGEGALKGATVTAALRGRVSLPARSFEAQAELTPRAESGRAGTLFEIAGPWESVTVRPVFDADLRGGEARGADWPRSPVGLPPATRAYAP